MQVHEQLTDSSDRKHLRGPIDVKINSSNAGIEIMVDGYGTQAEQDGYGTPIFVEFYEDTLRVILWNDINEADPMIVNMERARSSQRKGDTA